MKSLWLRFNILRMPRLSLSYDKAKYEHSWLVGPNWPNEGEIDIVEGVNTNTVNAMTLHTSDGCTITNDGDFTGVLTTSNCYIDAAGQSSNAGCDIQDTRTTSYGTGFNADGGGVIATEWTSAEINIWFFPRNSIPANVESGSPDPTQWGEPVAQFQGGCNIDTYFQNQQIVFDDTFCGDVRLVFSSLFVHALIG